jgi:hypothetical protein
MRTHIIIATVILGLVLVVSARSQSPMISYQGKLTDNAGEPLNATVSIKFSIYSQSSGGTALWMETQSSISVSNGIFNVLLGSINPIPTSVFNGSDRWLGMKVGSDAEMSPRQQIVSVGYALKTSDADMVDGQHASDFLSTANDWGRSGVASEIYEGTMKLSDKYVNETGPEEMTGNSADPILSVTNNGNGLGVYGYSPGNNGLHGESADGTGVYGFCDIIGSGVHGASNSGNGVRGNSTSGVGVNGSSTSGNGVTGYSSSGDGVYGESSSIGVHGNSGSGTGVWGYSDSFVGVWGSSASGYGGYFAGLENNGTAATLKIYSGGQEMLLDGNEIDALTQGLYLNHNSSLKVILASGGGNVGIGTTDPGTELHIRHSASGQTPTNISGLFVENDGSLNSWYVFQTATAGGGKSFSITNTGRVGIGTTSPGYKLDVAGSAHASSFPTSSDARLKTNVTQLTDVLEKLEKIRGVSFEWNHLYESLGRSTGHSEIGVIAQEVEAVFPELVTSWGEDEYKAVDYGRLTGVLIEAVKELKYENEQLEEKNTELQKRIETIENIVNKE